MTRSSDNKAPELAIVVDTREQAIPPFPPEVTVQRGTLDTGDYTTELLHDIARIERKSLGDLVGSLTHDRERFMREVERLRSFPFRLVIVEGDLGDVIEGRYRSKASPNSIVGSVCSLLARSALPVLFAHDAPTCGRMIAGILRRLEEEWHVAAERASA